MVWLGGTTARAVAVLFKTPLTPLFVCTQCQQHKPRESFSTLIDRRKNDDPTYRRSSWCRACASISAMRYRNERVAKQQRNKLAVERSGL